MLSACFDIQRVSFFLLPDEGTGKVVLNQIMPIINMKKAAQAAFSLAPPSSLYSSTLELIFTESELSVYF